MHHRTAHATGRVEPPLGQWDVMWQDDSWTAPIVALFTEPGVVVGMTADGGIIEGRTTSSRSPSGFPPPDTSLRKNQGDQAPQTERIPSRR